jgi:hypothetical protein
MRWPYGVPLEQALLRGKSGDIVIQTSMPAGH